MMVELHKFSPQRRSIVVEGLISCGLSSSDIYSSLRHPVVRRRPFGTDDLCGQNSFCGGTLSSTSLHNHDRPQELSLPPCSDVGGSRAVSLCAKLKRV